MTQVDFRPVRSLDLTEPMTLVAIAAAVLAFIAVLVSVIALRRLRGLRQSVAILDSGDGHATLLDLVAQRTRDIHALQEDSAHVRALLEATRVELASALRHAAVVRYDAFGDMGGRMSFSAALLDDNSDGLLITSIHGRAGTRTYMKPVSAGRTDQLSPEELEAIKLANGPAR